MGVLFAASDAPLASLDGAARALRAAPEDFAPLGIQRVEDFAAVRVLDDLGVRALAEQSALNTDDHNHLAARASRLGAAALNGRSLRRLLKDRDPLLAGIGGLDRSAMIRILVRSNFSERATALAKSEDKALEETGLGWVDLESARLQQAARRFARARKLAPNSSDALAGLVASRIHALADGQSVEGVLDADLDARLSAMIEGQRYAAAGNWDAVAALDDELSRIEPGEAFFEHASRLRIHWRLAAQGPVAIEQDSAAVAQDPVGVEQGSAAVAQDPVAIEQDSAAVAQNRAAAAEAQVIVERLLSQNWQPQDALLRARAAVAADHPVAAWGALSRIAAVLSRQQRPRALAQVALEIAEALPEELARDLRLRLQPGRPGAARH
jgi:hypothetical protein